MRERADVRLARRVSEGTRENNREFFGDTHPGIPGAKAAAKLAIATRATGSDPARSSLLNREITGRSFFCDTPWGYLVAAAFAWSLPGYDAADENRRAP
jgi:hypothetical protein